MSARKGSGRADEKDVIQGWLWQMKASRHVLDQGAAVTSGEGSSSSRMVRTLSHKTGSAHHTLLLLIAHLSLVWPIAVHMIGIRTIACCLPLDERAAWLQLRVPSSQTNALILEHVWWWGEGPISSSASRFATVAVSGLDTQLFLTAFPPGSSASRQFPNKQQASFLFRTFCLHESVSSAYLLIPSERDRAALLGAHFLSKPEPFRTECWKSSLCGYGHPPCTNPPFSQPN